MNGPGSPVAGPAAVLRRRAATAAVEVGDDTVLVDEVTGVLTLLNPTAAALWRELDGRRALAAVAEVLATRFGADPAIVLDDVVVLAGQLNALDLVQEVTER